MMSSSGISAFSRLLWSIRRIASCRHPLHERWSPRGARGTALRLFPVATSPREGPRVISRLAGARARAACAGGPPGASRARGVEGAPAASEQEGRARGREARPKRRGGESIEDPVAVAVGRVPLVAAVLAAALAVAGALASA